LAQPVVTGVLVDPGRPRRRANGPASIKNSEELFLLLVCVSLLRHRDTSSAGVAATAGIQAAHREMHSESARLLVEALRRTADVVATPLGNPAAAERLGAAERAIDGFTETLPPAHRVSSMRPELAVAAALGRIIEISRPFA